METMYIIAIVLGVLVLICVGLYFEGFFAKVKASPKTTSPATAGLSSEAKPVTATTASVVPATVEEDLSKYHHFPGEEYNHNHNHHKGASGEKS